MYLYTEKKKKNKKIIVIIIILFILLYISLKIFQVYSSIEIKNYNNVEAKRISQTIEQQVQENEQIVEMIENITNSVVGISKLKNNGQTVFAEDGISKMGLGSGIIISENGYILTNEHVSGEKNSTCYVTMEDGKNYSAEVIWSDSNLDLAIIKINMKCINFAKLGDSNLVKVGETVYAVGNPLGFEFQKTVTSGIISATNRSIVFTENEEKIYMSNLIQTDATINPGNSGGPLVNSSGEIIGINTIKITSAEGIGFAVPINVVKPILEKLEKNNNFEEASISIFAYDKNVIPYLDSNINFETGIYVAQISLDSPAIKSGLKIGDIIKKIDDTALEKMCDLREYIYTKNIGDVVNLTIIRNNKEIELEVTLSRK